MGNPTDYVVLARKYRSRTFAELIGQPALVRTLTNALASGRLHHAYLLTGIRGTGKTSTARLLAMALNCENGPSASWEVGDTQAENIRLGRHPDVLEFDAASNRGIDEIKTLFEGVAYAPMAGRFKVYIIDEVHMLTPPAFNALLKTLEEPPPQVKFIFATTDVQKVPLTVLSRCQRFDLQRVPAVTLAEHFTADLAQENIKAEAAAIELIARAADGSVRDGLSLLDQAIALSSGEN
ncbi:MAG: DNA polymerase III subunit gamma/tau, partial [Pseudomonadota bacterium]